MTRISDKPLAFQALQQRRRERDEASQAAAHLECLKSVGNQSINNPIQWWKPATQLRNDVWTPISGRP